MQGKDRKMLPPTCQDGNYLKKTKDKCWQECEDIKTLAQWK